VTDRAVQRGSQANQISGAPKMGGISTIRISR
jgi:hypothetical protein